MVHFRKYRLPFKSPFVTAAGSFSHREGILIEGELDGIRFMGDASALPGFSGDTLNEGWQFLNAYKNEIESLFSKNKPLSEFDSQCINMQAPPSVRFGLSTAMGNLLSQKAGLTLSRYLNLSSKPKVPVNVTLGLKPIDLLMEDALCAWKDGFKTFKIKVGQDLEAELAILKKLRKALPECHLRIDANGAWKTDEAVDNLNKLASVDIEYCEQPVGANDVNGMSSIQSNSPIPIAADESVRSLADARLIIKQQAADVLILKPMLIGTITEFQKIAELAGSHHIGIVITTSLESGIGRRATAHLAASLKNQSFAHGLATGRLLETDLLDDRELIKNGCYYLS